MARRDNLTMELPGIKKRPGRPATGKAKTGAQRMREYRARVLALRSQGFLPEKVREAVAVLGLPADAAVALFDFLVAGGWSRVPNNVTVTGSHSAAIPSKAKGDSSNG